MAKKEDEVIIIKGDAVVRVSASAFRQVMLAAGQMKDDWFDYAGSTGVSKGAAKAGFDALRKLSALAIKGRDVKGE